MLKQRALRQHLCRRRPGGGRTALSGRRVAAAPTSTWSTTASVAADCTLDAKLVSQARGCRSIARTCWGYPPDYVFTHVTRLVLSKALWRDVRVLEHLDGMLAEAGQDAPCSLCSAPALPAGRRPEWVTRWEAQYGWPVGHRGDNGDLIDQRSPLLRRRRAVQPAQRPSQDRLCQPVWLEPRALRQRMPADMEFMRHPPRLAIWSSARASTSRLASPRWSR